MASVSDLFYKESKSLLFFWVFFIRGVGGGGEVICFTKNPNLFYSFGVFFRGGGGSIFFFCFFFGGWDGEGGRDWGEGNKSK